MDHTKKIELLKNSIDFKLEVAADLEVSVSGDFGRWKELENSFNVCVAMLKSYSVEEHARYVAAGDFSNHVNAYVKAKNVLKSAIV